MTPGTTAPFAALLGATDVVPVPGVELLFIVTTSIPGWGDDDNVVAGPPCGTENAAAPGPTAAVLLLV